MNSGSPDGPTEVFAAGAPNGAATAIADHQLIRRIGAGAYGEVWLARNVLGAYRAVKIVYRRSFKDARPYEREFAGIKKFEPISRTHPGLISILHVGENERDGYFYYVMEIADDLTRGSAFDPESYTAKTLAAELNRGRESRGCEVLRVARALVSALAHLHESGLIHRDIKPANIIFVRGQPKLADIGLVTDASEPASFVGTAGYIPPEGPGTPQADVYSLGKVLQELCKREGAEERSVNAATEKESARLLAVALHACEVDFRRRYRSGSEMLEALEESTTSAQTKMARAGARGMAAGLLAAVAVLGITIAGVIFKGRTPDSSAGASARTNEVTKSATALANKRKLAVLPFENISPNREEFAYFAEGMTEQMISKLSRVSGLTVKSRNAVKKYKDGPRDLGAIAKELGVGTVLEGSVRRDSKKLLITFHLVDCETQDEIWSADFDRALEEVLSIQTEVAETVVQRLQVALLPRESALVRRKPTENPDAYDKYLKGSFIFGITGPELNKSLSLLEEAVRLDPGFAEAHAMLSIIYTQKAYFNDGAESDWERKAEAELAKALDLNPDFAEAHLAQARIYFRPSSGYHFEKTVQECLSAIAARPNFDEAYAFLGAVTFHVGLLDESRGFYSKALEINPHNELTIFELAGNDLMRGDYIAARRRLQNVGMRVDTGGTFQLSYVAALVFTGKTNEAAAHLDKVLLSIQQDSSGQARGVRGLLTATKAWLLALEGRKAEAIIKVAEAEKIGKGFGHFHHTTHVIASTYSALGDVDEGLRWLRRSAEDGNPNVTFFEKDPSLAALKNDRRFAELMEELKPQREKIRAIVSDARR